MAYRIRVEVQEVGIIETVLDMADAIELTGQDAWDKSGPNGGADAVCAGQYREVCREAAEGLREVIRRFDRRVQRHVEGHCKAH